MACQYWRQREGPPGCFMITGGSMALAGSDEEEKLDFLEKRLSNCEFIIVGLWVAARDALPSDTQEDIDKMQKNK